MEYFKKFYREIVTIILLLMGIYLLILLTLISKDSYIKYNSAHLAETRFEFIGVSSGLELGLVLDKSTGYIKTTSVPVKKFR